MSQLYKLRPGGLMRCCLKTLEEAMAIAEVPPSEDDTLPCRYCTSKMIFRNGEWQWDHPA